ncbi:ABC transporter ATP-binding protein [Spiroplasma litorale]|uniref:ABC transporter ATP-binding protein n=1 Tax=Spiroplasma litorale TaxID=216942 RepID=A0A0K1W1X1_9MOLU|nr:ABC transporter ATP-binding protein [Spiroplasma litorale]AKX34102.1 ABC transporter ATP-binding protein [Spiroplasma litorale]
MFKIRINIIIYIIFAFLHILSYALIIYSEQKIIDNAQSKNWNIFLLFCILLITFMLVARVFNLLSNLIKAKFIQLYKNKLREFISLKIIDDYKKDKNFEIPISWYSLDVEQIEHSYLKELLGFLFNLIGVIIGIVFLGLYNYKLLLITILITFIIIVTSILFQKKINKLTLEVSEQNNKFLSIVKDICSGFSIFWQNLILLKFIHNINSESKKVENKIKRNYYIQSIQSESIYTISTTASILIFIFCGYLLYKNEISVGSVIAITQLSATFTFDSQAAFRGFFKMISGKKIVNKYYMYKNNEVKINYNIDKTFEFKSLETKNLEIKYNNINILKNINLHIEKKQKILIIGESGSGKTSFIKVFLKIINNYSGEVLINDLNLKEIGENELFKVFYYHEQFPHYFNDTLKNNLTLWNENIDNKKINKVLKDLNLNIKNENLDSFNEVQYSGGEKQRLLIARAVLSDKEFMIFDEPTSSLDENNANIVLNYLVKLNKTVIIISHKYDKEIIKYFDKVVNLNEYK